MRESQHHAFSRNNERVSVLRDTRCLEALNLFVADGTLFSVAILRSYTGWRLASQCGARHTKGTPIKE